MDKVKRYIVSIVASNGEPIEVVLASHYESLESRNKKLESEVTRLIEAKNAQLEWTLELEEATDRQARLINERDERIAEQREIIHARDRTIDALQVENASLRCEVTRLIEAKNVQLQHVRELEEENENLRTDQFGLIITEAKHEQFQADEQVRMKLQDELSVLRKRVIDGTLIDVDAMVDRFLAWVLPPDFAPDNFITFDLSGLMIQCGHWPTGTNLLTAVQAKEMIKYLLDGCGLHTAAVRKAMEEQNNQ